MPSDVVEISTPGWRLTATQEQRAGFTVGDIKFVVTPSGWPNSTSVGTVGRHIAHSLNALHSRTPEKFTYELSRFNFGAEGAFSAIFMDAVGAVHVLHPEIEGYANKVRIGISTKG